jgi:hypothetical protein
MFRSRHPSLTLKITETSKLGAANGCPFCQARIRKDLNIGESFIILCGYDAGKKYVLEEIDSRTGDWICRADGDYSTSRRIVKPYFDSFLVPPLPKVPNWALPLSFEDHLYVDDTIMVIIENCGDISTSYFDVKNLWRMSAFFWSHRIPFTPKEVIKMLVAHGLNEDLIKEAEFAIDYARIVLESTIGRSAIKRRRIPPLSKFRYAPKTKL